MSHRSPRLSVLFALVGCVLALPVATGATVETRLDIHAPAGVESLKDWDPVNDGLIQAADELRAYDEDLGPDVAGRTIGQYTDEWVMTPEVQARLAALKKQAMQQQRAGDAAGLQQSLSDANRIVQEQVYRVTVLGNYLVVRADMREHAARIQEQLQKLPESERAAAKPTLDGPAQLLRAAVLGDLQLAEPPVEYADDGLRRYEQLAVDPLNAERVRIAWLASDSARARGVAPKGRDRATPCPEPAAKTSGADRPLIDRSSLAPLDYPADSQQMNYSGKVELEFHVAASGCVTRIDVYHSVGIDELDEAALTWGEAVRYFPAEKDGQRVDSTQVVSVTFKIAD